MRWKLRSESIKSTFIGIDLGTTFSAVAVVEMTPHEQWQVRNLMLSDSKGAQKGFLLSTRVDFSNLTYPQVGIQTFSSLVIAGFQFKPKIGLGGAISLTREAEVSPDKAAVVVLRHLYTQIIDQLSPRWEESVVTLAIPAPGDEAQQVKRWESFHRIAEEAGFQQIRLLDEPIAALLDVALTTSGGGGIGLSDQTVLVVDYGGGTCDVAIVRTGQRRLFTGGRGKILAVASKECGGVYIDKALANWLRKKHGDKINDKGIIEKARSIKEALYQRNSARKRELLSKIGLTERKFMDISRPVVSQLKEVMGQAIDQASRTEGEITIDQVVLTGGGSKHPLVKEVVYEFFDQYQAKQPRVIWSRHPQLNVSRGAAWYGLYHSIYQLPFYEEAEQDVFLKFPDGHKKRLIRKGESIPFKKPKRFAFRFESTSEGLLELPLYCIEGKEEYECAVAFLDFKERISLGRILILELSMQFRDRIFIKGIVPAQNIEADTVVYLQRRRK